MKLTNRTDICIALRLIGLQEHDRKMNEYIDELIGKKLNDDDIVINSLKNAYRMNFYPDKIDNSDEYIDRDETLLNAIDLVLDYYMTDSEKKEWILEKVSL